MPPRSRLVVLLVFLYALWAPEHEAWGYQEPIVDAAVSDLHTIVSLEDARVVDTTETARTIPQVSVTFGRLVHGGAVDRRTLRSIVRRQRERLRRCVESSPLYDEEGLRTLVVLLAVDHRSTLRAILREGSLGTAEADACITRALESATIDTRSAGTTTLSLRLLAS